MTEQQRAEEQRGDELVQRGVDASMQEREEFDRQPVSRWRRIYNIAIPVFIVCYIVTSALVLVYTIAQIRQTQACVASQTAAAREIANDDRDALKQLVLNGIPSDRPDLNQIAKAKMDFLAAYAQNEQRRQQLQLTASGVCR